MGNAPIRQGRFCERHQQWCHRGVCLYCSPVPATLPPPDAAGAQGPVVALASAAIDRDREVREAFERERVKMLDAKAAEAERELHKRLDQGFVDEGKLLDKGEPGSVYVPPAFRPYLPGKPPPAVYAVDGELLHDLRMFLGNVSRAAPPPMQDRAWNYAAAIDKVLGVPDLPAADRNMHVDVRLEDVHIHTVIDRLGFLARPIAEAAKYLHQVLDGTIQAALHELGKEKILTEREKKDDVSEHFAAMRIRHAALTERTGGF